ncbi:Chemotaxis protein histidine kinase CheA [Thiothrix eikelboomii]|uniref:Chemotaxis protein CheA n=1 Tax=Thiothrix eikelboomii TaxID=92487 RepID=A0A1T4WG45_9GAMM|nr:response regulator [Thiothrix eikelboomii]SKA76129.1 Chemotaxis protein histidine kinase CheA [Thiothrix eikelboomii]
MSSSSSLNTETYDSSALREKVGDDIYEIFVEEITEIQANFQEWIPQWLQQQQYSELLKDIRRGYHTCKGSGRMAGALALGDYAWAHECMLNRVLEKTLPINERCCELLNQSTQYLTKRLDFFLTATQTDADAKAEIKKVEDFIRDPNIVVSAEPDLLLFDSIIQLEAKAPASAVEEPSPELANAAFIITDAEIIDETLPSFSAKLDYTDDFLSPSLDDGSSDSFLMATDVFESSLPELTQAAEMSSTIKPEPQPESELTLSAAPIEELTWLAAHQPEAESEPELAANEVNQRTEDPVPLETPTSLPPKFDDQTENQLVWTMFREELPDQLRSMDHWMQALNAKPADWEIRRSLERELHTLKGGARMARLTDLGDLAHQAETLLEKLGRHASPQEVATKLRLLQSLVDQINSLAETYLHLEQAPALEALVPEGEPKSKPVIQPSVPTESQQQAVSTSLGTYLNAPSIHTPVKTYDSLLERLLAEKALSLPDSSVLIEKKPETKQVTPSLSDEASAALAQEQIRLPAVFLDKMIDRAGSLNMQQNTLSERLQLMTDDVGEFSRTASRLKQLLRSLELETEAQIHAGYRQSAAAQNKGADFDPLEMDQYSELQRLSRALAESLNDLVNIEADLGVQLRNSNAVLKDALSSSRYLHQDLLETRLVEAMVIVPRLKRIVRQTSSELGREVNLEVEGESFRLDRHLLQRMTAPIEHLLRNAVSHGIEPPQERLILGKAAQGMLSLKVFREDTEIVFQVQDDGRGLHRKRLLAKAEELGLIRAQESLSDQEVLRLILRPGFSTAHTLSQISGRGVGMDVVSSEVKALGGHLQISSVEGQGTLFTMRLPFAMAANPVLFVGTQSQTYALPLGYVQGLARLDLNKVREHLDQTDKFIAFSGHDYVVRYLGALLEPGSQLVLQDEHVYPVVFVRTSGGHCIAWIVDKIFGRREVVLQSLGSLFKESRFYSSATITSDGEVVLLPDMADLALRVSGTSSSKSSVEATDKTFAMKSSEQHERPHILVVDDSITVRKVTEKLLISENMLVGTAKDGLEALEMLDKFDPDLILMDIEMPRMDGFEVLETVRQNPDWNHVPIIMISSRTADKHQQRAEQLGANSFLGKPYQNQELMALIRRYLALNPDWAEEMAV